MKILHCIWRTGGGGAERQLAYLAAGLVRRGDEVHVAVVFPGEYDAHLTGSGCTVHVLGARGKYDPGTMMRLLLLIVRLRPDVVQSWLTQMDILIGFIATLTKLPWVLSERSSAAAYPPSRLHRVRVFFGKRAHAIAANSSGGVDYWRGQGAEATRIQLIPNAIPFEELAAAPLLDRAAYGIAPDDELIVYVGRFSAEKNLDLLIDALALLMKRRPVRAVFCGDGPLRASVVARARALGIDQRVLFTGFVSNAWSWMKAAAVIAAVSVFEGHPNAVLEAIAAGVPVVVSDIPAHRAILDESTAWLVAGNDPERLAETLESALVSSDSAARARLARQRIEPFSIDYVVEKYKELYLRVTHSVPAALRETT